MILPIISEKLNKIKFQRNIPFIDNKQKDFVNEGHMGKNLAESLQNYNFASKYYNQKLNNNKPLFDDLELLQEILKNNKTQKVLFLFLSERAKFEANLLKQKGKLTENEKQKLNAYNEIIDALPNLNEYITPHTISFKSSNVAIRPNLLTPEQKNKCHFIIHGASVACGGISAAMGEGAAVGADTPFLWGMQYGMFVGLQDVLGTTMLDHINYIARQYMMGQVLGVQGAKILISWLGIAGHASSGGTATAPVTAGVRAVNAALSTAITEKMGWGYISTYEKDNMKFKKQAIQTAIYVAGAYVFGHGVETVLDATNPDHIQTALESIPKENLSTMGNVMKFITNNIHGDRFAFMFVADVAQKVLFAKGKTTKEQVKNSIKIALLNTIIYDLLDFGYGETITEEAKETAKKLAEEFKNNPSVWKEFENSQERMFAQLDLDKLSVQEFQQKFKDKQFVYNLAMISRETTREVADKWRKRNFVKLQQERNDIERDDARAKKHSDFINGKISSQNIEDLASVLHNAKKNIELNGVDISSCNFGFAKVAGYEQTKELLNKLYLLPCALEQCGNNVDIPSSILFYGPSGIGKTMIGRAIAEEGSSFKLPKRSIDLSNCKQLLNWLKEEGVKSQAQFAKNNRRTIIQLNEFGKFENASEEDINNFIEFIKTCSEKYHLTLFLTSNDPLNIDKKILKFTQNVPMGVANEQDVIGILKYYLSNKDINDLDFNIVSKEIFKFSPNKYYSNAQLEKIAQLVSLNEKVTTDDILSIIQNMIPLINKEKIDKFEDEKRTLNPQEVVRVR